MQKGLLGKSSRTSGQITNLIDVPRDIIVHIFCKLPTKSLSMCDCVCKSWYKCIRNQEFVDSYYTNQKKKILISLRPGTSTCTRTNLCGHKIHIQKSDHFFLTPSSFRFFHFMVQIQDRIAQITSLDETTFTSSIVATCNSLILMMSPKSRRLVITNPLTRKLAAFPLGTLAHSKESYGLIFSSLDGVYKVVHLLNDELGYVGCKILSLGKKVSWKHVNGPPKGLMGHFPYPPVKAIGALHWLPDSSGVDHIVSLNADNESFSVTNLPKSCGIYDRLVEIKGSFGFVTNVDLKNVEIWSWMTRLLGKGWVKSCTICPDSFLGYGQIVDPLVPVITLNDKEMLLKSTKEWYLYEFEVDLLRKVDLRDAMFICRSDSLFPHSDTPATWESLDLSLK